MNEGGQVTSSPLSAWVPETFILGWCSSIFCIVFLITSDSWKCFPRFDQFKDKKATFLLGAFIQFG